MSADNLLEVKNLSVAFETERGLSRAVESVIHSGFLTTEVTGDGLDVMIGIHEHGRQQLAVVTTERLINASV